MSTLQSPPDIRADESKAGPQRLGWIGLLVITGWLLFVSAILAIRTALFDFGSPLSSADVNAVWAFVGSGLAAVVAVAGALFTSSYNERTLRLAQEAETRERHQAAAAFLTLLGGDPKSGRGPTSAQVIGAVLTLRELEHRDAARGILEGAVYDGTLNASGEASLISKLLESGDERDRLEASRLLRFAAARWTDDDRTFKWPPSIVAHWPKKLPHEGRINLLVAIGSLLSSRDRKWWHGQRDWAVFLLDEALREDDDESIRNGAHLLLEPLLASFRDSSTISLNCAGESRRLEDFVDALRQHAVTPRWDVEVRRVADRLKSRWSQPASS